MQFVGNFFLVIAALLYFGLLSLVYGNHNRSGDAGVGYAWVLIMANFGFALCLGLAAAAIGSKGGFAWLGATGSGRFFAAAGGFILVVMGATFFTFGEGMPRTNPVVNGLLRILPALLPALALLSAGLLLHASWPEGPPRWMRFLLGFQAAVGLAPILVLVAANVIQTKNRIAEASAYEKKIHQDKLNEIDSTDLSKNMVFLFVLTDANQDPEIRQRALAKIKTRPDWQEEIARRLQNDWAPEAFNFLASNPVDKPELFAEPVREGIRIQARLIRETIRQARSSYDLYDGQFNWEVERVLRTVERFEGNGVDYKPAVAELRKALDERRDFEMPTFYCKKPLDRWLAQH